MKTSNHMLRAIAFLLIACSAFVIVAQDDMNETDTVAEYPEVDIIVGADPIADDIFADADGDATIQSVTDESDQYYGGIVTLEGVVGDFVNARAFALGEGATIDNDLVLIVNNSRNAFDARIIQEARVRVTGRVHPSQVALNEGAMTDFGSLFTPEDGDFALEDNSIMAMNSDERSRLDMVDWVQNGYFPEGFENYTIIEIVNAGNVEFIEFNQPDTD